MQTKIDIVGHIIQSKKKRFNTEQNQCQIEYTEGEESSDEEEEEDKAYEIADEHEVLPENDERKQNEEDEKLQEWEDKIISEAVSNAVK